MQFRKHQRDHGIDPAQEVMLRHPVFEPELIEPERVRATKQRQRLGQKVGQSDPIVSQGFFRKCPTQK